MSRDHSAAWGDFWADNARNDGGGCLPSSWQGIDAAQRGIWRSVAQKLPRKARLLDLATGDGRVLAWLLKERRDIKPVGTDLATTLPPPPAGTKVRGGIAMEQLPFHNASFAAVTSQFGFEYGDTAKAAAEIARVLEPGGVVGLMTHRIDGPILAHNLARRAQIEWVLDEKGLVELAQRSLALRAGGLSTIPPAIVQAPAQGASRFGQGSAAWEIAEAIRQSLHFGQRDNPDNVSLLIGKIAAKARNELGRIASLEAACTTTADSETFNARIIESGLQQIAIEPVCDAVTGAVFADFRTLKHAS